MKILAYLLALVATAFAQVDVPEAKYTSPPRAGYVRLLSDGGVLYTMDANGNRAPVGNSTTAQLLPWAISGCLAAYDWRDVKMDATSPFRITQWNDKSGNGKHMTRPADNSRAQWTPSGAWPQQGAYTIAGGGITGMNGTAGTMVWIGADFTSQNPNTGQTATAGALYLPGPTVTSPRMRVDGCYSNQPAAFTYVPAMLFSPSGGTSIYAQSFGTSRSTFFTNGIVTTRPALSASEPTITKIFSFHDESIGTHFNRITQALFFFNRELTVPELVSIGAFYGARTSPPSTVVYCFGSSTPQGQGSGEFQKGCISLFANAIGADQATYSVGGSSWNGIADATATSGINLHKGTRGIHILIPQHNDLATNVPVATCQTAVTNMINRIRAADPFAWIILCPVTPRNASFSGVTYDDFDTRRVTFNSWLESTAAATAGIVYADAMTIPNLGAKGDEANTTYFDPDRIHMNAAGYVQYGLSIYRAWLQLNTGAWLDEEYKIVPFQDDRNVIFHDFRGVRKAA